MKIKYKSINTTKKEQKLNIKKKKDNKINEMITYLENKWQNSVKYTCECCLINAYNSVLSNKCGYITDDELILSSNNTLKHK